MHGESALATLREAAIWIGLAAGVFVLWEVRVALLLALGAVLVAILLRLIARLLCHLTRMSNWAGLTLAVALVVMVLALCAWLSGSRVSSEFLQLGRRLAQGERSLGAMLGAGAQAEIARAVSFIAGMVPAVLSASVRVLEYAIVIAIAAIYLAAQPDMYREGAAALFPRARRKAACEAFDIIGVSLQLWMMGQLMLMFLIGLLSFVAASLVGLPDPIALGLIAGVSEIVPYLGPFIGGAPAVLVALTQGFLPALWIVIAYLGIHVFEGYLVGPLLQRWFVRIPPALVLVGIVASQLLFGIAGIIFAAPLTVACYTAAKFLYVGATLKQKVELPKEAPF
jgi:predicted PurR-regulated permease PerM